MRENTEKWIELCALAAKEQDSKKLMALIQQITSLLDAKQRVVDERRVAALKTERTDLTSPR